MFRVSEIGGRSIEVTTEHARESQGEWAARSRGRLGHMGKGRGTPSRRNLVDRLGIRHLRSLGVGSRKLVGVHVVQHSPLRGHLSISLQVPTSSVRLL